MSCGRNVWPWPLTPPGAVSVATGLLQITPEANKKLSYRKETVRLHDITSSLAIAE